MVIKLRSGSKINYKLQIQEAYWLRAKHKFNEWVFQTKLVPMKVFIMLEIKSIMQKKAE